MTRRRVAAPADGLAPFGEVDESRLAAMGAVAKRVGAWKPGMEALTKIRSVPTIFPQLDYHLRVGGWPIERAAVIHGPSNHGKSLFLHGLGLSFLNAGHFYGYIDAEYTTPEDWIVKLMGGMANHPGFIAMRPKSYEETVDAVRSLVENIAAARDKGELPEDTTALIVVDSLRKLVPQRMWDKIEKHGADSAKGSIDGMGGMMAAYKAALNAQWLDELTPLLYHTKTALVFVGREAENMDGMKNTPDWKLTGGKAVFFDSSLVGRVVREKWIKTGEGDGGRIIGERHKVTIHKTKVGGKAGKTIEFGFHTSNGVLTPEGFDPARDLIEIATDMGFIQKKGAHLTWNGKKWHGANAAVTALYKDPTTMASIEGEVRSML